MEDRDRANGSGSAPLASPEPEDEPLEPERTPADDFADGLGLLLRGARRALETVDKSKLEELGRRAKEQIEQIDKEKIQRASRRAVDSFDPEKIETFAEDAGRELVGVVDRVASRVQSFVERAQTESHRDDDPPPRPKVRVDDSDDDR